MDESWNRTTPAACNDSATNAPHPLVDPMHSHWPRMRDELSAADWDLLLCSAGTLSAILCEHACQAGRKALDLGACDERFFENWSKA